MTRLGWPQFVGPDQLWGLGAQGKIVFVAPTKPLLSQQVEACYWKMGVSRVQLLKCCRMLSPAFSSFSHDSITRTHENMFTVVGSKGSTEWYNPALQPVF